MEVENNASALNTDTFCLKLFYYYYKIFRVSPGP